MSFPSNIKITEHISNCLQLAVLLEVSAYPKPGNVHRNADFHDTQYEHFLASAVALTPCFRHAARQGVRVLKGKIALNAVKIGGIIRDAVRNIKLWQHGGNTLLGTVILLSPIAVAAGMTLKDNKIFSLKTFRRKLDVIVKSTTPEDAVAVYEAIQLANPSGLGTAPKLDVNDPSSPKEILAKRITLFDVFKIASKYDSIASEWVNNYSITFDLGYPFFTQQLEEKRDINTATVHTFLKILSEIPDTLIARKAGLEEAKKVSARAKQILERGGMATADGKEKLLQFDKELRATEHKLNPGTTADLVSAVLAVSILNGYRP